jgi:Leucine-rich repeat (LRR) protein
VGERFAALSALDALYLGYNRISTVSPGALHAMSGLRRLELNNNELAELPDAVGALRCLESLNLAYNRLLALPAAVGQLGNLRELRLEGNRLLHLPPALGALDALATLSLAGNPLVAPDAATLAAGVLAVKSALRDMLQGACCVGCGPLPLTCACAAARRRRHGPRAVRGERRRAARRRGGRVVRAAHCGRGPVWPTLPARRRRLLRVPCRCAAVNTRLSSLLCYTCAYPRCVPSVIY